MKEIQAEAGRLDRSMSWVVQKAWMIARGEIASVQSFNDRLGSVGAEAV